MGEIVSSMFGPTPMEIQQAQRQAAEQKAYRDSQMSRMQQSDYLMNRAGATFGGMLGDALGIQNPELAKAQQQQELNKQIDLSTPESIRASAEMLRQKGDFQRAFALKQLADKKEQESLVLQSKLAHEKAQTTLANAQATEIPEQRALDAKNRLEIQKAQLEQDWKKALLTSQDKRLTEDQRQEAKREADATKLQMAQLIAATRQAGQQTAPIDQETVDFYAKQSIAGDNSWQVGLARGKVGQALISAVKDRIPQLAKDIGPEGVSAAKAERASLGSSLTKVQARVSGIEMGANKIERDIKTMQDVEQNGNLNMPQIMSKPLNWARTQSGSSDLAAYALAAKQVATEYERLMNGGLLSTAQLHEGARTDAAKILNENMTIAQTKAIIPIMLREIQNGREAGNAELNTLRNSLANIGKKPAQSGNVVDFSSLK